MRRSSQHLMSETVHLAGAAPRQPLADGLYKQAFEETNSLECGDEDEADSPSTSCKKKAGSERFKLAKDCAYSYIRLP